VTSGAAGVGAAGGGADGDGAGLGAGRGRRVAAGAGGVADGDGEAGRLVCAPPGPRAVDGTVTAGAGAPPAEGTLAQATRPHSAAVVRVGALPDG